MKRTFAEIFPFSFWNISKLGLELKIPQKIPSFYRGLKSRSRSVNWSHWSILSLKPRGGESSTFNLCDLQGPNGKKHIEAQPNLALYSKTIALFSTKFALHEVCLQNLFHFLCEWRFLLKLCMLETNYYSKVSNNSTAGNKSTAGQRTENQLKYHRYLKYRWPFFVGSNKSTIENK